MSEQSAPVSKLASMKRQISIEIKNPTDSTESLDEPPVIDVLPTPSADEVEATLEKELQNLHSVPEQEPNGPVKTTS